MGGSGWAWGPTLSLAGPQSIHLDPRSQLALLDRRAALWSGKKSIKGFKAKLRTSSPHCQGFHELQSRPALRRPSSSIHLDQVWAVLWGQLREPGP